MSKIYIGKFSENYPEQIKERFYAAGQKGNIWYNDIQPGDYVFPVFKGNIDELWRVKEYSKEKNRINKDGAVLFESIKKYNNRIKLSDEFTRYRYFEPDLNLLNKSSKSVKNCGFIEIKLSKGCPLPEDIEFKGNIRNIFVALKDEKLNLNERDFGLIIDNMDDTNIEDIVIYQDGALKSYDILKKLYDEKNEHKYSLLELLDYSKIDNASRKKKYIEGILSDLKENGKFIVTNPIALYDNVIVGRKRTASSKSKSKLNTNEDIIDDSEDEIEEDNSQFAGYVDLLKFNPNLILYGPPGTGKTYSTSKIIESMDRNTSGVYKSFEHIEREGRARFITFHQSYSYEEFIEGIRPEIAEDDSDENSSAIRYKVEDGILKQIANLASMQVLKSDDHIGGLKDISEKSRIWKISLGGRNKDKKIYDECIERGDIAIGWLKEENLQDKDYDDIYEAFSKYRSEGAKKPVQDAGSTDNFINNMKIGDVVFVYDGPRTIRDIGIVKGDYEYDANFAYAHRRKVEWIKHYEEGLDIYDQNGQKNLTLKTVYPLDRFNFSDLSSILKEDIEKDQQKSGGSKKIMPYYLIIDEINRGNISKIFGELITLIEKDKRGRQNCILPYSKKPFTVPENLYIIGTMNTADRSIALLDTALRRRFVFVEIEPDLALFDNPDVVQSPKVNNTVDLSELLNAVNKKIVEHLDRDHRIGHSYFIDIVNLSDLYKVWYYQVLPLLMEYFYGDIKSLKSIVGGKFFDDMGSINFLDYKSADGEISEFENELINIYKV
ncbi:AAA family ATPase [Clostridium tyrobutyricum]|uniref:AAA family ATPase n=1 Tax=Clostridium tyrobutyricum TaxID=1519 RepID=UPI0011CA6AEE|nr:AAA family ATPase [Clostridium tyrobutyricum]